jgi:hypothetical protein
MSTLVMGPAPRLQPDLPVETRDQQIHLTA